MRFRSSFWLALVAVSVMAAGCRLTDAGASRSGGAERRAKPSAAEIAAERDRVDARAHYGAAVILEINGESARAHEEYFQAALKDPGNEELILEVSRHFLLAKEPEQALKILEHAAAMPRAPSSVFARMGFVYSTLGQPELAIQANRKAIKREPKSLVGYQNLYINYFQNRQEKEALAVLDEAAKVPGTDAEFLIGLTELYANFGLQTPAQKTNAFAQALRTLERAEHLNPREPFLRLRLADAFNLLGEESKAGSIYAALLKQELDIPYVRENIRAKLRDIYLRDRNRTNAVEQLESLVRENPTDTAAYYLLGNIAVDDKKFEKAAEYFSKALLVDPSIEEGYYALAGVQINAGQDREALETLTQARTRFAPGFRLEYLSALAYNRLKDYTNAAARFNAAEAVALAATDGNRLTEFFYFEYGMASERRGDFAQAEKCFEKCLQLAPNNDEAQNYLGFMWAERGIKLDEARALIEQALKAEPENPAYLDSMGWVLFKQQQPEPALEYLLKALQFSPEPDAEIYDHLGDVYAGLGEAAKAREAWRKSLSLAPDERVQKKLEPGGPP